MKDGAHIKGLKKVDSNLRKMNKKTGRRTVLNALRPAGRMLRDAIRPRVAVASGPIRNQAGLIQPGQLRKSVAVATIPTRFTGPTVHAVRIGFKFKTGWYGHFPEIGYNYEATPAFRPGFDSVRGKVPKMVGGLLWDQIESVVVK